MNTFRAWVASVLLLVAGSVAAQGTVTDGGASYVINASHWDTTPSVNYTGVGTGDQLFEAGWFFRVEGDVAETVFPAPDSQNYVGNIATITWANMAARNLAVTKTHVVTEVAAGQGETISEVRVTNNTGAAITLHLFHAADFDVNGSAGTDSAGLAGVLATISDATAGVCEYRAPGAVAGMARPFAAATDVFGLLGDAVVTNLDDSGYPFGPGDFTGAFQWTQSVADGATLTVRAHLACNTASTPVSLQSFQVD